VPRRVDHRDLDVETTHFLAEGVGPGFGGVFGGAVGCREGGREGREGRRVRKR